MRSYGHVIMAQDKGIRFPPKHHDHAALIHSCHNTFSQTNASSSSYLVIKTISICFQIRYMMHVFFSLSDQGNVDISLQVLYPVPY